MQWLENLFIVVFPFNAATNDPYAVFEREMSALHVEMSQPIICKHQGEQRAWQRPERGEHELGFNLITNLASREESCMLPSALDSRDKSPIMDVQTQED